MKKKLRKRGRDEMLLTGFDSKYLNTLYVDKNLKYHGLIQAFSRTNRVINAFMLSEKGCDIMWLFFYLLSMLYKLSYTERSLVNKKNYMHLCYKELWYYSEKKKANISGNLWCTMCMHIGRLCIYNG